MSLGLSATSAAILGGSAVLSAGIGAAGASGMFGGGGGGGGGGSMSGLTKAQMDQYIAATSKDADRLLRNTQKIASLLNRQVTSLGNAFAQNAGRQEKQAIARIQRANTILARQANSRSERFSRDIQEAIDDLKVGAETLNLESRADTLAQLDSYKSEIQGIEATALERVGATLDKADTDTTKLAQDFQSGTSSLGDIFLERANQALTGFDRRSENLGASLDRRSTDVSDTFRRDALADSERLQREGLGVSSQYDSESKEIASQFEATTVGAADRFRSDSAEAGDQYRSAADRFLSEYRGTLDEAANLTPERLATFSRAADFLSNAAVQTRMNMLATADPRALELSALADENTSALMSGRIGADMQANMARSSAMRALQGGFGASSEMGRGLAARDLGLTSLELQQRGMQDFERQRMLNYNTRVAGLQADATGLLRDNQQLLAQRAGTTLQAGLNTAESDRNQRQAALGTELASRTGAAQQLYIGQQGSLDQRLSSQLDTLNRSSASRQSVFGTDLTSRLNAAQQLYAGQRSDLGTQFSAQLQTAESDRNQRFGALETGFQARANNVAATRDQSVGLARDIFGTRANTAGIGLEANLGNLNDIYNNRYNTVGTMFNARTALGEQLFKTGIGLSSDMYSSAVNASSDFYGTNVNVAGNIFSTNAAARTNAVNLMAQSQRDRLDAMTRARGAAAGTMAAAAQQDMLNQQQATASRNAMWGSLANTGASLAGSIFGTMYKTPSRNPTGWGNFDYGSGTGA